MWPFRRPDVAKLKARGDIRGLIGALRHDMGPHFSNPASDALVGIGEPAVLPLCRALRSRNGDSRARAADVLGRIGDPRAIEPLARAVRAARYTWDSDMRKSACYALARIGGAGVDSLIYLLGNPEPEIVEDAAWALAGTRDPRAVEPFSAIAAHMGRPYSPVQYQTRHIAIEALGLIGDRRAVPALITALADNDWYVQNDAARALGKLGDPAAVEPLCKLLKHSISNVRASAADALGCIGDPRAIEPLLAAKDGEYENARLSAMAALRKLGYWQTPADFGDESA